MAARREKSLRMAMGFGSQQPLIPAKEVVAGDVLYYYGQTLTIDRVVKLRGREVAFEGHYPKTHSGFAVGLTTDTFKHRDLVRVARFKGERL
jgi:hypothetical protein